MKPRILLSRLGHAVLSLLFLSAVIFLATRATGDPTNVILPETATPADHDRLRQELGLDQPLPNQFLIYVGNLARGDLGYSYRFRVPVIDLIQQRLPRTVELTLAALAMTLAIGIPMGVYAAYRRGGTFDKVVRFIAVLGQSTPSFWLGLILILVVAVWLKVLPSGGQGGIEHLILPAFVIASTAIAGLTRLLRSSMIEVLDSDYVKFLRLKGVPEWKILWKHGLRNGGLSSLTFVGVLVAGLLTGTIVVETVFVWPGIGLLVSQAISARDFGIVQGVVLMFAVVYVVANVIVDLLYGFLNPRLRAS